MPKGHRGGQNTAGTLTWRSAFTLDAEAVTVLGSGTGEAGEGLADGVGPVEPHGEGGSLPTNRAASANGSRRCARVLTSSGLRLNPSLPTRLSVFQASGMFLVE